MRLAHFSDFHIGHADPARDAARAIALVDHALASGAEHVVISGDLVDHGNLEDLAPLVAHLEKRDLLDPDRLTVVPGNHDIWPFGEGSAAADIVGWLKDNVKSLLAGTLDLPAQRRFEAFGRTFAASHAGARRASRSNPFPCVKRVAGASFALLDTTAPLALRHAQGRFDEDEAAWVLAELGRHEGPRILVMHHWPFEWKVVDPDDVITQIPRLVRGAIELFGGDPEALARDLVDVNFGDLPAVRRFLKEGKFDAVFCGHLHLGDGGVEDPGFERSIGKVPVHCMGRSGAVHQDRPRRYAYHLAEVGDRVRVETVFVAERKLA